MVSTLVEHVQAQQLKWHTNDKYVARSVLMEQSVGCGFMFMFIIKN